MNNFSCSKEKLKDYDEINIVELQKLLETEVSPESSKRLASLIMRKIKETIDKCERCRTCPITMFAIKESIVITGDNNFYEEYMKSIMSKWEGNS